MSDVTKRIIYPNDDGGVSIIVPSPNCNFTIEEIATKDVPAGKPYQIINVEDVSSDRIFRNAWTYEEQIMPIGLNLNKAKEIAHEKRRIARAEEFQPYDEIIMKQIPSTDFTQAEAARQAIRDKYALMQTQMGAAQTADELKTLLPG